MDTGERAGGRAGEWQTRCNVCHHEIHPVGATANEYRCSEDCRCLIMGCVPTPSPPPDVLLGTA